MKKYNKNWTFEYIQVHCPDGLKGGPISAGPERPTQRLNNLIETLLKSLLPTLKICIKDNWDFLRNLPTKKPFESTMFMWHFQFIYFNTHWPWSTNY